MTSYSYPSPAAAVRPSIFQNNRTKCLSLVILGLYTLYNRPSLAQQLHSRPEIVIILMKWTGYALLWIFSCYRWLLSKTFWTIFYYIFYWKKSLLCIFVTFAVIACQNNARRYLLLLSLNRTFDSFCFSCQNNESWFA